VDQRGFSYGTASTVPFSFGSAGNSLLVGRPFLRRRKMKLLKVQKWVRFDHLRNVSRCPISFIRPVNPLLRSARFRVVPLGGPIARLLVVSIIPF